MEIFRDGWTVCIENSQALLVLILTILGLGAWGAEFLRLGKIHFIARFLISLNIGTLVVFWISAFTMLLGQFFPPLIKPGSLILVFGCTAHLVGKIVDWLGRRRNPHQILWGIGLGLCLFLYLLIRLAFLSELILPPYDDSPEHFVIIRDLLNGEFVHGSSFYSLSGLIDHYYHFGFHFLSSWLTVAVSGDAASIMGLIGQVFIVFSALSTMLLTLTLTRSLPAGLISALLTAFAWKMPAFAANWGKYPAIMGFALLPGWLALIFYFKDSGRTRWIAAISSVLIIFGLGLIHTRLIPCLFLAGLGWIAGAAIPRLINQPRIQTGICVSILLLLFTLFAKQITLFYSGTFYLSLIATLLLAPFAVRSFPGAMIGILTTMVGCWIAFKMSLGGVDGRGVALLDAPFVEMMLFIPLSLLAGLGIAGVQDIVGGDGRLKQLLMFAVGLLMIIPNLGSPDSYYPDACCNFVSDADMGAIKWLEKQSPHDAVIWTAGFKPRNYMIGTDAGIWVFAFTGRNVNKLEYDFEWEDDSARLRICQTGYDEVYVYLGGQPFSFKPQKLEAAAWLNMVFMEGNTKIYSLDCSP